LWFFPRKRIEEHLIGRAIDEFGDIPGLKIEKVQNIELPGILEAWGQITFDDRGVARIVSRVQG